MSKNLVDLLHEDLIKLNVEVNTWEEALGAGVQLLIDSGGSCRSTWKYIKMIKESAHTW